MELHGLLQRFPKHIKMFISAFVIVLSIGYITGLQFVRQTESIVPNGLEENYLGNEDQEDVQVMKFKKGKREMLTIIHTHILSMSFIFFLLGSLVWLTKLSMKLKLFLTVEPFVSVLLTFGGIYFLWTGVLWMKYVIIFSGFLMSVTFAISTIIVLYQLILKPLPQH